MESIWTLIGCCALVLLFLVGFILAAIYTSQNNQCATNPNYWCFNDWTCDQPDGSTENVSQRLLTWIDNCKILTQDDIDQAQPLCDCQLGDCTSVNINCDPSTCQGQGLEQVCQPFKAGQPNWNKCSPVTVWNQ